MDDTKSVEIENGTVQEQNDAVTKMAFEVEEKVLCFHGPLMYEAKVQSGKFTNNVCTNHLAQDFTS
jgi:hypothetical protein